MLHTPALYRRDCLTAGHNIYLTIFPKRYTNKYINNSRYKLTLLYSASDSYIHPITSQESFSYIVILAHRGSLQQEVVRREGWQPLLWAYGQR